MHTPLSTPLSPAPSAPRRPRSLLAPPSGVSGIAKDIFWNETELRAGWRLLIYLVLFGALTVAGIEFAVALRLTPSARPSITARTLVVQDGVSFLAAAVAAWIMKALEGRVFGAYGLPGRVALGKRFWQGAAWGTAMITAIMLLIWVFHGYSPGELALHGGMILVEAALWGVAFLCVALFEEFLFRGYAQFTLSTGLSFWPAATVLSASFSAVHLGNSGEGPAGAASVFVIAMFFCLTLRRTGNLWFAVGAHAAFDWCETFLFSVPDSGFYAPGQLLNSGLHGSVWLTGALVGPEGSVMAFAVVGVAALIFSRVFPPTPHEYPE